MNQISKRLTASLTAAVFFMTGLTGISQTGHAYTQIDPIEINETLSLNFDSVKLPEDIGMVAESYQGSKNETLILIQDAHSIPDAQRNIQKIIHFFAAHYGIQNVGVEGAASKLDPQIFRSFPDQDRLKKVIEGYAEKGELSGSAMAAIIGPQFSDHSPQKNSTNEYHGRSTVDRGQFFGLEDAELYEQGLGFYLEALDHQPELLEEISKQKAECRKQKQEVYPKELFEIDQALEAFYENRANLLEVLKALSVIQAPEAGSELALLLEKTSNQKPVTSNQLSVSLDQEVKKVAKQIRVILSEAKNLRDPSAAPQDDAVRLNGKIQDYQTSQITAEAFALELKELIEKYNLPVRFSKKLKESAKDEKRMRDIEGSKLMKDFENYAEQAFQSWVVSRGSWEGKNSKLTTQDSILTTHARTKELRLIEKLAKLELTKEEWNVVRRASLAHHGIKSTENHPEQGYEVAASKELTVFLAFYENAEARDRVFLKNLFKIQNSNDPNERLKPLNLGHSNLFRVSDFDIRNSAILVAGGFHTQGLVEQLKANGISYLLIRPAMQTIPEHSLYQQHMRGEVSWNKYFRIEDGKLNPYKAFVRAARDQLISGIRDKGKGTSEQPLTPYPLTPNPLILKLWRDQIIRDLAKEEKIDRAGEYTRFLDEMNPQIADFRWQMSDKYKERLNRFINGLRRLDSMHQVTEQNILNILKPSTITDYVSANLLVPDAAIGSGGYVAVKNLPDAVRLVPGPKVRGLIDSVRELTRKPVNSLASMPVNKPTGAENTITTQPVTRSEMRTEEIYGRIMKALGVYITTNAAYPQMATLWEALAAKDVIKTTIVQDQTNPATYFQNLGTAIDTAITANRNEVFHLINNFDLHKNIQRKRIAIAGVVISILALPFTSGYAGIPLVVSLLAWGYLKFNRFVAEGEVDAYRRELHKAFQTVLRSWELEIESKVRIAKENERIEEKRRQDEQEAKQAATIGGILFSNSAGKPIPELAKRVRGAWFGDDLEVFMQRLDKVWNSGRPFIVGAHQRNPKITSMDLAYVTAMAVGLWKNDRTFDENPAYAAGLVALIARSDVLMERLIGQAIVFHSLTASKLRMDENGNVAQPANIYGLPYMPPHPFTHDQFGLLLGVEKLSHQLAMLLKAQGAGFLDYLTAVMTDMIGADEFSKNVDALAELGDSNGQSAIQKAIENGNFDPKNPVHIFVNVMDIASKALTTQEARPSVQFVRSFLRDRTKRNVSTRITLGNEDFQAMTLLEAFQHLAQNFPMNQPITVKFGRRNEDATRLAVTRDGFKFEGESGFTRPAYEPWRYGGPKQPSISPRVQRSEVRGYSRTGEMAKKFVTERAPFRSPELSRRHFLKSLGIFGAAAASLDFPRMLQAETGQANIPALTSTMSVQELEKYRREQIAKLQTLFTPGRGIDEASGYPFDHVTTGQIARWTQPTLIGMRAEELAHRIAGDTADDSAQKSMESLKALLANLKRDQDRFGWKGLLPWFKLDNREVTQDRIQIAYVDNANLTVSMMNTIGSLIRAHAAGKINAAQKKIYDETLKLANDFLSAQEIGYKNFYDPHRQLFYGAGDPQSDGSIRFGGPSDRLFAEHGGKTAAIVACFGIDSKAFLNLPPVFRNYTFRDGKTRKIAAPWDGGAFQMSWFLPYVLENENFRVLFENFLKAATDEAYQKGVPGLLSAAMNPVTASGWPGYEGKIGHSSKETSDRVWDSIGSLYGLDGFYLLGPEVWRVILEWRKGILSQLPELDGASGNFDSANTKREVAKYHVLVDHYSSFLSLIGKQAESFQAFMKAKGKEGALKDLLASVQFPKETLEKIDIAYAPVPVIGNRRIAEQNPSASVKGVDETAYNSARQDTTRRQMQAFIRKYLDVKKNCTIGDEQWLRDFSFWYAAPDHGNRPFSEFENEMSQKLNEWLSRRWILEKPRSEVRGNKIAVTAAMAAGVLATTNSVFAADNPILMKTTTPGKLEITMPWNGSYTIQSTEKLGALANWQTTGQLTATNAPVTVAWTDSNMMGHNQKFYRIQGDFPTPPNGWTRLNEYPNFATKMDQEVVINPGSGERFEIITHSIQNLRTGIIAQLARGNYGYYSQLQLDPSEQYAIFSFNYYPSTYNREVSQRIVSLTNSRYLKLAVAGAVQLGTAHFVNGVAYLPLGGGSEVMVPMQSVFEEEDAYLAARSSISQMTLFMSTYLLKRSYVVLQQGWVDGIAPYFSLPNNGNRPFEDVLKDLDVSKLTLAETQRNLLGFEKAQNTLNSMKDFITWYLSARGYDVLNQGWLSGFAPYYTAPAYDSRTFQDFETEINANLSQWTTQGFIRKRSEMRMNLASELPDLRLLQESATKDYTALPHYLVSLSYSAETWAAMGLLTTGIVQNKKIQNRTMSRRTFLNMGAKAAVATITLGTIMHMAAQDSKPLEKPSALPSHEPGIAEAMKRMRKVRYNASLAPPAYKAWDEKTSFDKVALVMGKLNAFVDQWNRLADSQNSIAILSGAHRSALLDIAESIGLKNLDLPKENGLDYVEAVAKFIHRDLPEFFATYGLAFNLKKTNVRGFTEPVTSAGLTKTSMAFFPSFSMPGAKEYYLVLEPDVRKAVGISAKILGNDKIPLVMVQPATFDFDGKSVHFKTEKEIWNEGSQNELGFADGAVAFLRADLLKQFLEFYEGIIKEKVEDKSIALYEGDYPLSEIMKGLIIDKQETPQGTLFKRSYVPIRSVKDAAAYGGTKMLVEMLRPEKEADTLSLGHFVSSATTEVAIHEIQHVEDSHAEKWRIVTQAHYLAAQPDIQNDKEEAERLLEQSARLASLRKASAAYLRTLLATAQMDDEKRAGKPNYDSAEYAILDAVVNEIAQDLSGQKYGIEFKKGLIPGLSSEADERKAQILAQLYQIVKSPARVDALYSVVRKSIDLDGRAARLAAKYSHLDPRSEIRAKNNGIQITYSENIKIGGDAKRHFEAHLNKSSLFKKAISVIVSPTMGMKGNDCTLVFEMLDGKKIEILVTEMTNKAPPHTKDQAGYLDKLDRRFSRATQNILQRNIKLILALGILSLSLYLASQIYSWVIQVRKTSQTQREIQAFYQSHLDLTQKFSQVDIIGAEHFSIPNWQGRRLELIAGAHGARQAAKSVLELSKDIIRSPQSWIFVIEGSKRPETKDPRGLLDILMAYQLSDRFQIPVLDPLPDQGDPEVLRQTVKSLGITENEVIAVTLFDTFIFTYGTMMQQGKTPADAFAFLLRYREMTHGLSEQDIRKIIQDKLTQLKAHPQEKITFADTMNQVTKKIGEVRDQIGKARASEQLKSHPDRKNILALVGMQHLRMFDQSMPARFQAFKDPFITVQELDQIILAFKRAGLVSRSEVRSSAPRPLSWLGFEGTGPVSSKLTRQGVSEAERSEMRIKWIVRQAQRGLLFFLAGVLGIGSGGMGWGAGYDMNLKIGPAASTPQPMQIKVQKVPRQFNAVELQSSPTLPGNFTPITQVPATNGAASYTFNSTNQAGYFRALGVQQIPADLAAFRDNQITNIGRYMTLGAGIDSASHYPYDHVTGSFKAKWTQPTAIGMYAEWLAHGTARDIPGVTVTQAQGHVAELNLLLTNLLRDQGRYGWNGLLPWFKLDSGVVTKDSDTIAFVDNGNLTRSIMRVTGSLLRAKIKTPSMASVINPVLAQCQTFLSNQSAGYPLFYDSSRGLFRGARNGSGFIPNYHIDRFAEHVGGMAAILNHYGLPPSALTNLTLVFRNYTFRDGQTRLVLAPWDGGAFQVSWNVPELLQNFNFTTVIQNFSLAAADESYRLRVPGLLSAAMDPQTGLYAPNIGYSFGETVDPTRRYDIGSFYALSAFYPLAPVWVLEWEKGILEKIPAFIGSLGPYDSANTSLIVSDTYVGVDQIASALGLLGLQDDSFHANLEHQGTAGSFRALLNQVVFPAEAIRPFEDVSYPPLPHLGPIVVTDQNVGHTPITNNGTAVLFKMLSDINPAKPLSNGPLGNVLDANWNLHISQGPTSWAGEGNSAVLGQIPGKSSGFNYISFWVRTENPNTASASFQLELPSFWSGKKQVTVTKTWQRVIFPIQSGTVTYFAVSDVSAAVVVGGLQVTADIPRSEMRSRIFSVQNQEHVLGVTELIDRLSEIIRSQRQVGIQGSAVIEAAPKALRDLKENPESDHYLDIARKLVKGYFLRSLIKGITNNQRQSLYLENYSPRVIAAARKLLSDWQSALPHSLYMNEAMNLISAQESISHFKRIFQETGQHVPEVVSKANEYLQSLERDPTGFVTRILPAMELVEADRYIAEFDKMLTAKASLPVVTGSQSQIRRTAAKLREELAKNPASGMNLENARAFFGMIDLLDKTREIGQRKRHSERFSELVWEQNAVLDQQLAEPSFFAFAAKSTIEKSREIVEADRLIERLDQIPHHHSDVPKLIELAERYRTELTLKNGSFFSSSTIRSAQRLVGYAEPVTLQSRSEVRKVAAEVTSELKQGNVTEGTARRIVVLGAGEVISELEAIQKRAEVRFQGHDSAFASKAQIRINQIVDALKEILKAESGVKIGLVIPSSAGELEQKAMVQDHEPALKNLRGYFTNGNFMVNGPIKQPLQNLFESLKFEEILKPEGNFNRPGLVDQGRVLSVIGHAADLKGLRQNDFLKITSEGSVDLQYELGTRQTLIVMEYAAAILGWLKIHPDDLKGAELSKKMAGALSELGISDQTFRVEGNQVSFVMEQIKAFIDQARAEVRTQRSA